jgi:hypothetical protein
MVKFLTIAEGTPHQIVVWDMRGEYRWADPEWDTGPGPHKAIIYHHTADRRQADDPDAQVALMRAMADEDAFRLPYNFLVWGGAMPRVFYLNDVDKAFPHTYAWNDATAIALQGNYQIESPNAGAVARIWRLTKALESMWGKPLPHYAHRDLVATICPGLNLYNALRAFRLLGK